MAEERVQRRLAAILFADAVGSSVLLERNEAAALAALKRALSEVIEPQIARRRGRIVKFMGDGALAVFDSAVDAVDAAIAIQTEMSAGTQPDGNELRFRIGINVGDVIVEGDDIYGDAVGLAARMQALAEPGGIAVSHAVHNHVRGKVSAAFVSIGEQRLKNLIEPVQVFRVDPEALPKPSSAEPVPGTAPTSKPSIAVLPFDNLSGDAEAAMFADGLAEDVITELSRVPSLLVIARNSTFTYKGRAVSIKDVARDLGVQYVMEGSVRRSGDQIRIAAQLIDAVSGAHVWAERFDRAFISPFDLQDDIVRSIVATLHQQLYLSAGRAAVARRDRSNTDLWSLLQRSWVRLHDLTPEAVAEAREVAERALAMAPDNARANFLVGCMLFHQAIMMYLPDYEALMKRALFHGERAIALDENDEHAHWSLGGIYWALGQRDAAVAEFERTLEINPNWSLGLSDLGECLCYMGRAREGLAKIEEALRMNPRDPSIFFRFAAMAIGHYVLDEFEAAERWARKAVQRRRQFYFGHVLLVASLARLGRIAEAAGAAQEMRTLFPKFTIAELKNATFAATVFERLSSDLRSAGIPE